MANGKMRGWFHTDGRPGDRTLNQQLLGLAPLFAECKGKTILDVGAAEGLIAIELGKAGALAVHGIEVVAEHVEVGNRLRGDLPITFEVQDANTWIPKRDYDIVIALALLQKLKDPSTVCARLAASCLDLMVLRLPPDLAPTIVDDRSGRKPHHTHKVMEAAGFDLISHGKNGPFGEWVGFWRRHRA